MKRNQTAYVILGMLSIGPHKSGYDLRKAVESSVSYFWRESYGQIYPTLKRLADEGLIIPRRSTSGGRPERQEYSLSAKGRTCLREWLAAPHRIQPPRSEFLLKLFFGRSASPHVCLQHIRQFQEDSKRLLSSLLEIEKQAHTHNAGNPHLPFWLLTLSFGIALTRAGIEWSESALAKLVGCKAGAAVGRRNKAALKSPAAARRT
jgi:DNA-binding PadR family transcriptional regulator